MKRGIFFAPVALAAMADGTFTPSYGSGMLLFSDRAGDVRYSFLYTDVGNPLMHEKPATFAQRVLTQDEAEEQKAA